MNNQMKKIFIITLIISLFYSCKDDMTNTLQESYLPDLENGDWRYTKEDNLIKSGRYIDGYKTGLWEYRINNSTENLYWSIYKDSQIKVNYPKSWKIKESGDNLFYSIVDRQKEDFFLIKRYDKKEFNLSLDRYFSEAIMALNKRGEEKIINYACVKLEYKKRNAYYFRFNTERENLKTAYYIFYTEDDNFVYDSTFKVNGEAKMLNKEIFAAVVYSLGVKGEKLFHNNDELIASTQVKIEDLN